MPVTRERVDPVRDQSELGLVHRRWILPDDVQRPVVLPQFVRLWRGLLDLVWLSVVAGHALRGGAAVDLGGDKGELKNGAVFLLEELACRAALSIELPREPQSEELPDAAVARLLQEAFGPTDELADDAVPPA